LLVTSVSEPRETSMIYLCGATTAPFIHPQNVFGFGGFPLAQSVAGFSAKFLIHNLSLVTPAPAK
jgi:hypothetical protein